VVGVADQYMIMMAISLLFTVLSIAYKENVTLGLLAGISWLISSLSHFAVGQQTSPLTTSLSWLFLAFGIIFIVKTVITIASMRHEQRLDLGVD